MQCAPLYPALGLESEVRSVEGPLSVRSSWLEMRNDGCQVHKTHVNTERPMFSLYDTIYPCRYPPNVTPFLCLQLATAAFSPLSQPCRPHYFFQRSTKKISA